MSGAASASVTLLAEEAPPPPPTFDGEVPVLAPFKSRRVATDAPVGVPAREGRADIAVGVAPGRALALGVEGVVALASGSGAQVGGAPAPAPFFCFCFDLDDLGCFPFLEPAGAEEEVAAVAPAGPAASVACNGCVEVESSGDTEG